MIVWLATAAIASDLAVTSLGVQGVRAEAIDTSDLDLLLGQRVRWGLTDDTTLLGDGRFTIDPAGTTTFERSRVRSLGIALERDRLDLLAGRHPVRHGGARLIDGAQALLHPDDRGIVDLGAWAGLVPDPFTTKPLLRPGGGPVVAYNGSTLRLSALGEAVANNEGLDRIGALAQAQLSYAPAVVVSTRLDWLFTDGQGNSGLVDGAASVSTRPMDALRVDANYNAYSALRYETTAALDPTVQRFNDRVQALGLTDLFIDDGVDTTLQHTVGGGVRVRPPGDGVQPLLGVTGRGRAHPAADERYARVGPHVGATGIGDRLEVVADGAVAFSEGRTISDAGLTAVVDLVADGAALADGSVRLLIDPVGYDGKPGTYADLFLDAVANSGTVFAVGGSWTLEPSPVVGTDVGWAAFLRVQQWIRPPSGRAERHPAVVDASEEDEP